MNHVKTINTAVLKESACKGGCGECQTSCQSACKTSCTVANQKCENKKEFFLFEKMTGCRFGSPSYSNL